MIGYHYEELATKLISWKDRQQELVELLRSIRNLNIPVGSLEDQDSQGNTFPLAGIDPFTFFGSFNRNITDTNRKKIIISLKESMGVGSEIPCNFSGIPLVNNLSAWFFAYSHQRRPVDIPYLWSVFEEALKDNALESRNFADAFNNALTVQQTSWNLTMALFWIRPKVFLNLDGTMRSYLHTKFNITAPHANAFSFDAYHRIIRELRSTTNRSFPELSHEAWQPANPNNGDTLIQDPRANDTIQQPEIVSPLPSYGIQDMVADGVFLDEPEIERIKHRLETKKNLILQGAPGVGKTFVAKKLAYLLMGEKADDRIVSVQFHPSYSYEDFVRGYRPTDEAGKFQLVDGIFWKLCDKARQNLNRDYVILIDEINRGNLSQIFGELFMLLEADKRNEQVSPLYSRHDDLLFSIPDNVHLIGTMNIADRSLALVDYALRRRFAFVTLEPQFNSGLFSDWLEKQGVSGAIIQQIKERMTVLNSRISNDSQLGEAFRIGHSFFCQKPAQGYSDDWFKEIIETEIIPLLEEYWHDNRSQLNDAIAELQ